MGNLELFKILFKINLFTFGGGYTIAPVILDEFAKKRNLIKESEMIDMIALAQSGPGALAVSTCMLVGYKINGISGAITSLLAAVLPPLMVISTIFYFYEEVATNYWVRYALNGMSGIICAVLIVTTIRLAKNATSHNSFISSMIIVLTFVVGYFLNVDVILIIVFLAAFGLIGFGWLGIGDADTN